MSADSAEDAIQPVGIQVCSGNPHLHGTFAADTLAAAFGAGTLFGGLHAHRYFLSTCCYHVAPLPLYQVLVKALFRADLGTVLCSANASRNISQGTSEY